MMGGYQDMDPRQAAQAPAPSGLDDQLWNLGMNMNMGMHMSALRNMSSGMGGGGGYNAAAAAAPAGLPEQLMMMPAAAAAAAAVAAAGNLSMQMGRQMGGAQGMAQQGAGALAPSVMTMLPPGCKLENIIPGRYDTMAILYRSQDTDRVGSAIWDGSQMHNLGTYDSENDASQAAQASLGMLTVQRRPSAGPELGAPVLGGLAGPLSAMQPMQQDPSEAGMAGMAQGAMGTGPAGSARMQSQQEGVGYGQQAGHANPLHMLAAASGMVSQGAGGPGGTPGSAGPPPAGPPAAYRQSSITISTDMRRQPSEWLRCCLARHVPAAALPAPAAAIWSCLQCLHPAPQWVACMPAPMQPMPALCYRAVWYSTHASNTLCCQCHIILLPACSAEPCACSDLTHCSPPPCRLRHRPVTPLSPGLLGRGCARGHSRRGTRPWCQGAQRHGPCRPGPHSSKLHRRAWGPGSSGGSSGGGGSTAAAAATGGGSSSSTTTTQRGGSSE
jgi:hypothetical protein